VYRCGKPKGVCLRLNVQIACKGNQLNRVWEKKGHSGGRVSTNKQRKKTGGKEREGKAAQGKRGGGMRTRGGERI